MLAEPERTFAGRLFSASQATSQAQTATLLGQSIIMLLGKTVSIGWFSSNGIVDPDSLVRCDPKGIEVTVLDETDQFLKLAVKDHVEYVKMPI